jgi:hypothetical protein
VGSTTKHAKKNLQATKKWKKSSRVMYATCHARDNRWTSSKLSCLVEPLTPSLVTKEQAQAMTKKYLFFSNPKKRGCLLFDALAWQLQHQVKSKSHDKDAHQQPKLGCPRFPKIWDACMRICIFVSYHLSCPHLHITISVLFVKDVL